MVDGPLNPETRELISRAPERPDFVNLCRELNEIVRTLSANMTYADAVKLSRTAAPLLGITSSKFNSASVLHFARVVGATTQFIPHAEFVTQALMEGVYPLLKTR